jgi:ABC-type glycerol-3-phosphate transport system permease component
MASGVAAAIGASYALAMARRDSMIDLHLRISRKLAIALVIVFVLVPLIWMALQTLGGSSDLNVGPLPEP